MHSINYAHIGEIRHGAKSISIKATTDEELDGFLVNWPDVDYDTGLSRRGGEPQIKAREAIFAAVHTFNGAGLTLRAEMFIFISIITLTYLLHAWFRQEKIEYRYRRSDGTVIKIKQEADCC